MRDDQRMSYETIPSSLRAGDSASWSVSLADYPASAGWVLAYRLVPRVGGDAYDIPSTAAVDDHVSALNATQTGAWVAGDYTLVAAVSKGSARATVYSGPCAVLPDLFTAAAADTRSQARQIVDAIDAWISTRAAWAARKTVSDRTIESYPLPDLLHLRQTYEIKARREEAAAALLAGQAPALAGRVMTRF